MCETHKLPATGCMLTRRLAIALAATSTAALTAATSPAAAEYKTTTSQALAAHAEWLPYAPPPPNGAAAVCLVDTGVDLNPDTASNVIARIALDGGDPSDLSDSKHGTQMAMVMGAPMNDWGMVGFWPGVRIVSVRPLPDPSGGLPYASYRNGIEACLERAIEFGIVAIALPLGAVGPASSGDDQRIDDEFRRAHAHGLSVVAAAGNTGGATEQPAAQPGAFVVGAADLKSLCAFSAQD